MATVGRVFFIKAAALVVGLATWVWLRFEFQTEWFWPSAAGVAAFIFTKIIFGIMIGFYQGRIIRREFEQVERRLLAGEPVDDILPKK